MSKSYMLCLVSVGLLSCSLLFSGCKNKTDNTNPSAETVANTESIAKPATEALVETPSEAPTEIATEETTEQALTHSLTLTIVNMCGADIGMFSVIDPATGEQVNFASLKNEEMISIEANWPEDTMEFQWAIYNQAGELYMEGKTDISTAKTSVTILLSGDGSIDDIEEIME